MSILDDDAIYRVGEIAIWDWLSKYTELEGGKFELIKSKEDCVINVKSNKYSAGCKLVIGSNIPLNLFRFGLVEGEVQLNNITDLQGSPEFITQGLYVTCDDLVEIKNWGTKQTDCLTIFSNGLVSIKTLPQITNGLYISYNPLLENLPEKFTGTTLDALKCYNLKNLPQFEKEVDGFIDISGCYSLPISEFKKLPDKVLGNVYMQGLSKWELFSITSADGYSDKVGSHISDKIITSLGNCYY